MKKKTYINSEPTSGAQYRKLKPRTFERDSPANLVSV